jgi:HAD superfamily phosphoserine phosphatase-like hydrolase
VRLEVHRGDCGKWGCVIVASDLEGTISFGETWRGMKAYLEAHGRARDFSKFRTGKLPQFALHRLGLMSKRDFQNAWITSFMSLFAGHSSTEFRQIATWTVEHEILPKVRSEVLQELETAKASGARVILASGTYQPVLEVFAARFGFEAVGTPLEIKAGKLTGRIVGAVNVGEEKLERLRAVLGGETLTRAYGDTPSDIPMLEAATEVVIASGDAKLEKIARARGWRIIRA